MAPSLDVRGEAGISRFALFVSPCEALGARYALVVAVSDVRKGDVGNGAFFFLPELIGGLNSLPPLLFFLPHA